MYNACTMTKTQIVSLIAEKANLSKSQVTNVLELIEEMAIDQLKSSGAFVVPGLVKLTSKDKPATPERQGVNPFTKAPVTIPAKPASKKVAARPVGSLKKAITE